MSVSPVAGYFFVCVDYGASEAGTIIHTNETFLGNRSRGAGSNPAKRGFFSLGAGG